MRILPSAVGRAVSEFLSPQNLREIRLRAGRPVQVWYGSKYRFLAADGLTDDPLIAFKVTAADIESSVLAATEHSVYAYNDDIGRGFVSLSGGARMGICGEIVSDRGKIVTVKNFSSLNIRLPHEIAGCAASIMSDIVRHHCRAMIISPPGAGKTTMLRDVARSLSDDDPKCCVLVADERREIACCEKGVPTMNVGMRTDVVTDGMKSHTFECAVRAMRPDVIVTDEMFGQEDVDVVREAVGCGIGVIATAHASDAAAFSARSMYDRLVGDRLFERYYFLSATFDGKRVKEVRDVDFKVCDVG